ncbi:hypothetical protein FB451DRAFT_1402805 [Mycena latifolia]|nr:hypothetical protein FB451DRAFT_1402805 [Mycena latifolia]
MDAISSVLHLGLSSTIGFEQQAKSLIAAAEANIARIESQIRDLERLRDRERGLVARLRLAIAPIHKLPAELLVEIFRIVGGVPMTRNRQIKQLHALSQVSSYWRKLAHTTPQLWTEPLYAMLKTTPTDEYLAGVRRWLERSAPLPVPVILDTDRTSPDPEALMEVLATAAHWWQEVDFRLKSMSMLSRIPPNSLETLEQLTLRSPDTESPASVVTFLNAPRLRQLDLITRRATLLLPMPWSQLTKIAVNHPSPQACLDAFVQCTNIVSVTFETFSWPALPDLSSRGITTLSQLENLVLYFFASLDPREYFIPFLTCLAFPALKNLNLSLIFAHTWASAEFTQFQKRSPNIECLSIDNSNISGSELLTVLQHASSLVELHMEDCPACFDDTVAAGLKYSEVNMVHVAPKLKVLSVLELTNHFREDTLCAMIQSRWWSDQQLFALPIPPKVARWSRIEIYRTNSDDDSDSDDDSEFQAKIAEYRDQGLDITVC